MDKQKLIKQLFIGKVSEILGVEKTTELLKESTDVINSIEAKLESPIQDVIPHFIKISGIQIEKPDADGDF